MASLSAEDTEYLTALFQQFVTDLGTDEQTLTVEAFEQLLTCCGYRFTKDEIVAKFVETDTDGDWKISLDEFLAKMAQVAPSGSPDSIAAGIRRAFNARDANKDGFITVSELEQTVPEFGCMDKELIQGLVKEYDEDGDGKIDFEEFVTMYLKTQILDTDEDVAEEEQVIKQTKNVVVSADELREYCKEVESDGCVTITQLKDKMASLSLPLTDEQFDQCIAAVGADESGQVRFEEFVNAYEDAVINKLDDDRDQAPEGAEEEAQEEPREERAEEHMEERVVEISADLEVDRDELLNKPPPIEDQEVDANSNNTSNNIMATHIPKSDMQGQDDNEESSRKVEATQNDTYVIQDVDVVKSKKKMFEGSKPGGDKKGLNPDILSCNVECKAGGINVKAMMAKFEQGKK